MVSYNMMTGTAAQTVTVLILIVVEDGLVLEDLGNNVIEGESVLILIVVEDGLVRATKTMKKPTKTRS